MSAPPVIARRTRVIDLGDGVEVEIRGLSRAEARHLTSAFRDGTDMGDVDGAEVWLLTTVMGWTETEATRWREETDADVVGLVIDGIVSLSGLAGDGPDPKPSTNGSSSKESETASITF